MAPLAAQYITNDQYTINVVQTDGQRLRGFIGYLTDSTLQVYRDDDAWEYRGRDHGTVAFSDIKRVIIKRTSKRSSRIKGAIVGGVLAGFAVLTSHPRSQFRSQVITAVNVGLSVGVGVLTGTLAGHLIGNTARVVIRPVGTDPETIARSLRLQLEPFSYEYQQQLINKQPIDSQ